jgi:predicted SnoaL-like aldol condensation-catalyzing enzyme
MQRIPEEELPATSSNKDIVIRALTELFVDKDVSALDRHWGELYIQHNPHAPNGTEGLRGLVSEFGSGLTYEMGIVTGDGDFVTVQGRYSGVAPVPIIAIDIFRLREGKIVEHWDVAQDEITETASGNPMFSPTGAKT